MLPRPGEMLGNLFGGWNYRGVKRRLGADAEGKPDQRQNHEEEVRDQDLDPIKCQGLAGGGRGIIDPHTHYAARHLGVIIYQCSRNPLQVEIFLH